MENIIEVQDLVKSFRSTQKVLKQKKSRNVVEAVSKVSFEIKPKEIISVVGESGSGKTTLGRLMVRLIEPDSGSVLFEGNDIFKRRSREMLEFRKNVQMILQDPYDSLNPLYSILNSVSQPLSIFQKGLSVRDKKNLVVETLEMLGLRPAEEFLNKRPGELSGGQRQRVSIARAMIMNPKFIVADEPVSMLDVSLRAEILNKMKKLTNTKDVSFMFITHDIATAKFMGDRMLIFYKGTIVEQGRTDEVVSDPKHPYTKLLIDSVPSTDPKDAKEYLSLREDSNIEERFSTVKVGCKFANRCQFALDECRTTDPHNVDISSGHKVACFLYG